MAATHQTEKVGWVLPQLEWLSELGDEAHWGLRDCRIEGGYLLRMRVEKRQVSSHLLQQLVHQRFLQAEMDGDKLNRQLKKALRDEVREDLLTRSLPNLSYCDAFLNDKGRIYLFSQSKKIREQFEQLFRETFIKNTDSSMLPLKAPFLGKYHSMIRSENGMNFVEALQNTVPSTFVKPETRIRSHNGVKV